MKAILMCLLTAYVPVYTAALSPQTLNVRPHYNFTTDNKKSIQSIAFSGDGSRLVTGDAGGNILGWDLNSKSILFNTKVAKDAYFVSFVHKDQSVVIVDKSGAVSVYDIPAGVLQQPMKLKAQPVTVCIDAGKQYLAVQTKGERIEIYDLNAMMTAGSLDMRNKIEDVLFLGFDRLGQQLIAISKKGKVMAWSPLKQTVLREVTLGGNELYGSRSVVMAASTNRASNVFVVGLQEVALATGGQSLLRDNKVIVYDWQSGAEIKRLKTGWRVDRIALGPGADHVAAFCEDNKAFAIIDLRKGEMVQSLNVEQKIRQLAVSENNEWLAAGLDNGQTQVWSMEFNESGEMAGGTLPSLSGRIRSTSGTDPALKKDTPARVAIVSFEAKGVSAEWADLCLNSLSGSLANVKYLTLIERAQIDKIIKEQDFSMTDFTEQSGLKIGQLLSADYLILGSIGKLGSIYVISARILDVQSGKVTQGREVVCEECRDQDLYDALKMLAGLIAR